MAQTTAEILDLALLNAGETTNGNSSYEVEVLSKLNRVYENLVSGGTISLGKDLTVQIDEVWPWAREKSPMILELQPAHTSGFVSFTKGSEAFVFSAAPTASLEGWHISVNGREEWFKIAQHTAASLNAEIDGIYPDESITSAFRAVKFDYALVPAYVVINDENNKIQFYKTASAGSVLTGTLTKGTYALSDLASHVASVMTTAAAGPTITGSYSSVTRKFSLVSDGVGSTSLRIVGNGDQSAYSVHKVLGFEDEVSTAGLTQTASYVFGAIGRLIEPFAVNKGAGDGRITSLDSQSFMREYPLVYAEEGVPDRFAVIREDASGAMTVRFNRYVRAKTRVEVSYVPKVRKLFDSSTSVPVVPSKHIDVLEDAATYFVMLLKSDDRAMVYGNLVQGKLMAMLQQHRGTLVRSGENFGRIVPRRDLLRQTRRPQLYYPTPTASSTDVETVSTLISASLNYTSFQASATQKVVTARTLPANRTLHSVILNVTQGFGGGAISALTLEVGITTDTDQFIATFDGTVISQQGGVALFFPGVATAITVTANSTSANLSELTAGTLTIYFQESLTA